MPPPMPEVSDDIPQPAEQPATSQRRASARSVPRSSASRLRHDAPVRPLARSLADRHPRAPSPAARKFFVLSPNQHCSTPRASASKRLLASIATRITEALSAACPHPEPDRPERARRSRSAGGPARLLRRRRPRHPDRRAGAAEIRRARLRAPRDRPQPIRRRIPRRPKAPFLWRSWTRSRKPMQPVIFSAHGVPKAVPAAAKARNMFYLDATCPLVSKVHVEAARHHEEGLRDRPDRPRRPSRGDRHDGPAARRAPSRLIETAADARAFVPRDPAQASPTSRRRRCRWTTRPRSSPSSRSASRTSSGRTRKTSATRRPTARRRSRRSRPNATA